MEQELNELIEKMERLKEEQDCLNEKIEEALNEYTMLMIQADLDDIDEEVEEEEICQRTSDNGVVSGADNTVKGFFKVVGLMSISALLGYSLGIVCSRPCREVIYEE